MNKDELEGNRSYPSYKDSGTDWLDEIPSHWHVERSKSVLSLSREKNGLEPVGGMLSVSGYRGVEPKEYDYEEQKRTKAELADYRVVRIGQLVVNTMWLNYAGLGVSEHEGYVSPAYRSYNIDPSLDGNYLHHLMRSSVYVGRYCGLLYGIRPNSYQIKNHDWDAIEMLVPPLPEQQAIGRFLDHKTSEIDTLIAAKERLITLLQEKRAALITTAVTKGLDTSVPMKDSGVEWLGRIPAHWEVLRLGQIGDLSKGNGGNKQDEVEQGVPCIRYGDLYTTHNHFIHKSRSFVSTERSKDYTSIEYGDVLFAASGETMDEIGKSAVNLMRLEVCCGGDIILFRAQREVDPLYMGYATDCHSTIAQKATMGRGFTVVHIYGSQLKKLVIPLPPVQEQQNIGRFLDQKTMEFDMLITRVQEGIGRLQEYRAALISAAVTGKIDVRDYGE